MPSNSQKQTYAYYLFFCLPSHEWIPENWLYSADAQCDASWVNYNATANPELCSMTSLRYPSGTGPGTTWCTGAPGTFCGVVPNKSGIFYEP